MTWLIPLAAWGQALMGTVQDAQTGAPLAYASVQVLGDKRGCLTDAQGHFRLSLVGVDPTAEVRISHLSYVPGQFALDSLCRLKQVRLALPPRERVLPAVTIDARQRWRTQKVGVPRYLGAWNAWGSDDTAAFFVEVGQRMELGTQWSQLTTLAFYLSQGVADTALFRVVVYRYDRERQRPGEQWIEQDLLFRRPLRKGWVKLDLSPYRLWLKGEVVVSVQYLRVPGRRGRYTPFFGGNVLVNDPYTSFVRSSTEPDWRSYSPALSMYGVIRQPR